MKAVIMISIIIILVLVQLILLILPILQFTHIRYDLFCPSRRCSFRKKAFFTKNYYSSILSTNEPPFKIVEKFNDDNSPNIISYSLYGTDMIYFKFINDNILTIEKYLPKWKCRIYLHDRVDKEIKNDLINKNAQIFIVNDDVAKPGNSAGAFWRFLPFCENVNCVILDIDGSINEQQCNQIENFFETDDGHILQYRSIHPWPKEHMMAGTIYKKKGKQVTITDEYIKSYPHRSSFGSDEIFLAKCIYPLFSAAELKTNSATKFKNLFVRESVLR